ncbi:MAG TPA: TIGR02757 family protein [Kiritimatiellia bacterium]|nr:TIGR02757 family protein [Kiritimatiellia bacterium]
MSGRAPRPVHPNVAARLAEIAAHYHRPEYIAPDPLQCVRRHARVADREVVALLAATLAFGRVSHIIQSVERVLARMGPEPGAWLAAERPALIARACAGCRHRWVTEEELANLLVAARGMIRAEGSMGAAWARAIRPEDVDAHDTLARWVAALDTHGLAADNALIPRPDRQSACKRLHLFLRWMIRCDVIDPGGWADRPARLLFPLDVHMHRMGRALGFTRRSAADLKTARELTARFRMVDPDDPVRFDFALTRMPIRDGLGVADIRRVLRSPARVAIFSGSIG